MYRRRRRRNREIAFSLDSFLDVITNVTGIIIRMILVVWVGARSYHEIQSRLLLGESTPAAGQTTAAAESVSEAKIEDPLEQQIAQRQFELKQAQEALLAHLRQLPPLEGKQQAAEQQLATMAAQQLALQQQREGLNQALAQHQQTAHGIQLSMAELNARSAKLHQEIAQLNQLPTPKKTIQYRTPVSRVVEQEELFFECAGGQVAFVDFTTMCREMNDEIENRKQQLIAQGRLEGTTRQVGAFRLHYLAKVVASDPFSGKNRALVSGSFEPAAVGHGETLAAALQANSEFRQIVDYADAKQTVVTFWVYPDSFPLFRQLRDYLYQRDFEVAARPLPHGQLIGFSPNGTASRSQ
jgi:hypothetical protein